MVVTGMDADPLSDLDSTSMNVKKLIAGGGRDRIGQTKSPENSLHERKMA
jgi:hypothetical protein